MKRCLLFLFIILQLQLYASSDTLVSSLPYKINLTEKIPTLAGATVVVGYGTITLPKRARLTVNQIQSLKKEEVNSFDRKVFKYTTADYPTARRNSDVMLFGAAGLPSILLLDKTIRRNWLEISTLYYQSQLMNAGLLVGTSFIHRPRPYTYNADLPIAQRQCYESSNSFYSGHTSLVAVSTFFTAKVYNDYHKLNIWQKTLLFTAASIPPLIVAHYRIQGGKHFRTDVISGFALGAAFGILTPEMHKITKDKKLSLLPFYSNQQIGLAIQKRF